MFLREKQVENESRYVLYMGSCMEARLTCVSLPSCPKHVEGAEYLMKNELNLSCGEGGALIEKHLMEEALHRDIKKILLKGITNGRH